MTPDSGYFQHDGLNLHYLRWGEPKCLPIVMLHGLRAYAQTWQSLAAELAEEFCCYALDQRGRGSSDWGPTGSYHTEVYVRDLKALVDHLNLERFILIGHSLGGTNALEFARQYPERVAALVIEDIGPGSSNRGEGSERIRREMRNTPLVFSDWEEAENFWRKGRPNLTAEGVRSRLQYSMREDEQGGIVWKHDQSGIAEARLTITPTDLWPAVESMNCPTLLVRGGQSDFLPQETVNQVMQCNANFQAVEISGASHYVHDDCPEAFNRAVTSFVREQLQ
ncbi:alpha/beta hydrolase [Pseudomaricurvus alkylphenolicus]|uniref:alpha/beta fold hydrolase n=1 Tax=Pseudomaricurvus alkylphenolicus TaxID=1306991 RepID=UPI0014213BA5|nr:alpha/beta hydrolase [Pseudomaricurvus alkylphenolicus]NIB38290.1 alpha/beta hydrolase [Pseudomaricurvus alkylphenolicus]